MSKSPPAPRQLNWNRLLINALWVVMFVQLFIQLFILWSVWGQSAFHNGNSVSRSHALLTDTLLLALLVLLEFINARRPDLSEGAIAAGSHVFAILLIMFMSPDIHAKPLLLLLPMLVTILYMRMGYLAASACVCLLYMLFLFGTSSQYDYALRIEHLIYTFVFLLSALTGYAVILRERDLTRSLANSVKAEQDLRIQNIIMDRLSKIDPLTDLYNHKTFHEYFGWLIEHQQSNPFPMQLAILDIDNFKKVNDTYGHWVGDIALKQVAATILKHIDSDDFAARYGGEEFVVILTSKSLDHSRMLMESVRTGIMELPVDEMEGKSVTVSIGMHDFNGSDSKSFVFQKADDALYEAKKTGKNKIVVL
ncbi:GGDEF domain-containing protein [Paenibacillus spiritus]|uniref:GGDEF domain-containing protein n=1 Tax=Paenibacillus spiritus TaxID=2496557 RepID=A0A5J5G2J4_9BACL|nr:GGDEF domain-containing protein [Paenibacillus spiritus]KAA9000960.1 GGDEF domain-containing protein [Paenibacillus spiritus]